MKHCFLVLSKSWLKQTIVTVIEHIELSYRYFGNVYTGLAYINIKHQYLYINYFRSQIIRDINY